MSATKDKLSASTRRKILAWLETPDNDTDAPMSLLLNNQEQHNELSRFILLTVEEHRCLLTSEEIPLLP